MIKSIRISIMLLLTFVTFGCNNCNTIESYLNQLYANGELNGNVLIIKEGKTLYEKSFGYTDASKTTKLNKDYRFIIGSVYKEFPAVAIMQLYEQKRINLDDKIFKYIPGFPKWTEKVSIKHLLQYSSGLPLIDWNTYFKSKVNVTDSDLIEGLKSVKHLEFEPGSDYLYSNNNPILLIKIVETITQLNFNDYLQEYVFNHYDMSDTVIKEKYPFKDKEMMTFPFDTNFKEDDFKISVRSVLFSSTARDLSIWLKLISDFIIVNKESVKILSEKVKTGHNTQAPLGHCDWEKDKLMVHSHHGSSGSYECVVRRFKQEDITIVILTNQKHGNVYDISDEIYKRINKN